MRLAYTGSNQLYLLSFLNLNLFHSKRYLEWDNFGNQLNPDFKMLKAW